MQNETYQGYTNKETWGLKLWIDNDQALQEHFHEVASEALAADYDLKYLTQQEEAERAIEDYLKEWTEENNPLRDEATLFSDLMQSAMDSINYREIAKELMKEVQ